MLGLIGGRGHSLTTRLEASGKRWLGRPCREEEEGQKMICCGNMESVEFLRSDSKDRCPRGEVVMRVGYFA